MLMYVNTRAVGVACRYPLLLDRLLKLTPHDHEDRDDIIQARKYVEETLSVINAVRRITHSVIQSIGMCQSFNFETV